MPQPNEATRLARRFHETYNRLAPLFGYRTSEASAKPWAELPENNRALMIAVCAEILSTGSPIPSAADLWPLSIQCPVIGCDAPIRVWCRVIDKTHIGFVHYERRNAAAVMRP